MASPASSSQLSAGRTLSMLYLSLWAALDAVVGESRWFDASVVSAEAKMQDVEREAANLRQFRDERVLRQVDQDIAATQDWIANLDPSSAEQLSEATTFLSHLRDLGLQYRKPDAGVDLLATGQ